MNRNRKFGLCYAALKTVVMCFTLQAGHLRYNALSIAEVSQPFQALVPCSKLYPFSILFT